MPISWQPLRALSAPINLFLSLTKSTALKEQIYAHKAHDFQGINQQSLHDTDIIMDGATQPKR